MVKKEQWQAKWDRDKRPPWWRRCLGSETPELPAAYRFSDAPDLREELGKLADEFSQLYVVGHYEAGADSIQGGTDNKVTAQDVYDLVVRGLPHHFNGTIKIYACSSALAHPREWGGNFTAGSFADAFARLAYQSWPDCKVYGYDQAVKLGGPGKFGPTSGARVPIKR